MMDRYEKQFRITEDVITSSNTPDILLCFRNIKRVILVEVTVPWAQNEI